MKPPKRFERAIKKLVHAFFNDELGKGNCQKCAVGNMCDGSEIWTYFVWNHPNSYLYQRGFTLPPPNKEILKTGYSIGELALIENAFELNTKIDMSEYSLNSKKEIIKDQYNGLMAVVDVLCEIEGIDAKEWKEMFDYSHLEI